MNTENYVYKKEVDWSLLIEGLAVPIENQVIFGQIMGRFLQRGEKKQIKIYLDGRSYDVLLKRIFKVFQKQKCVLLCDGNATEKF